MGGGGGNSVEKLEFLFLPNVNLKVLKFNFEKHFCYLKSKLVSQKELFLPLREYILKRNKKSVHFSHFSW